MCTLRGCYSVTMHSRRRPRLLLYYQPHLHLTDEIYRQRDGQTARRGKLRILEQSQKYFDILCRRHYLSCQSGTLTAVTWFDASSIFIMKWLPQRDGILRPSTSCWKVPATRSTLTYSHSGWATTPMKR